MHILMNYHQHLRLAESRGAEGIGSVQKRCLVKKRANITNYQQSFEQTHLNCSCQQPLRIELIYIRRTSRQMNFR